MTPADLPRFIDHWRDLAFVAADLLRRREESYPGLVGTGRLAPDDAANGLRIMRAIVADWRRLINGHAPLPADAPTATTTERTATLDQALARCCAMVAKERLAPDYPACIEAMIWHEHRHGGPSGLADANHAIRVRYADAWAKLGWRDEAA